MSSTLECSGRDLLSLLSGSESNSNRTGGDCDEVMEDWEQRLVQKCGVGPHDTSRALKDKHMVTLSRCAHKAAVQ